MDIRKISIGPDYKNAMSYLHGQEVLGGSHKIHLIFFDESKDSFKIWIENESEEVLLWKEFTGMPVSIEYNINFLMNSPYCFIVKPLDGKRYNNTKEVGGINLIVSTSQEDHTVSNRLGVVDSTPIGYTGEIAPGDLLLVHHNVFKLYYDMKGNEKSGASFLKDDLFMVDEEQFFMYFHNDKWSAHSKYCFVKPIKNRESIIYKNTEEEPLIGTIEYINQELLDLGLSIGDEISFEPNSEYSFYINDEKLYRMLTKNITIKWN